jgi:hypothetical protein
LIIKLDHSRRYQLTEIGRRVAVLFTKTHGRLLGPGLSLLDPHLPGPSKPRSTLHLTWRRFESALDDFISEGLVAA